jgi:hypothetical protein
VRLTERWVRARGGRGGRRWRRRGRGLASSLGVEGGEEARVVARAGRVGAAHAQDARRGAAHPGDGRCEGSRSEAHVAVRRLFGLVPPPLQAWKIDLLHRAAFVDAEGVLFDM